MRDNAEALVNREEPIPVIVSGNDGAAFDGESKQRQSRQSLYDPKPNEMHTSSTVFGSESGHSLQDLLFSMSVSCYYYVTLKNEAEVQEMAG